MVYWSCHSFPAAMPPITLYTYPIYSKALIDLHDLFESIAGFNDAEKLEGFFRDFCTMQELKMFSDRWAIAKLVHKKLPYRIINEQTGASSSTIARLTNALKYGNGAVELACQIQEAKEPVCSRSQKITRGAEALRQMGY